VGKDDDKIKSTHPMMILSNNIMSRNWRRWTQQEYQILLEAINKQQPSWKTLVDTFHARGFHRTPHDCMQEYLTHISKKWYLNPISSTMDWNISNHLQH
jgi:hypothetical protein